MDAAKVARVSVRKGESYRSSPLPERAKRLLKGSSSLRTSRGRPICCRCTLAGLLLEDVERERFKRKKRFTWRLKIEVRPVKQCIALVRWWIAQNWGFAGCCHPDQPWYKCGCGSDCNGNDGVYVIETRMRGAERQ